MTSTLDQFDHPGLLYHDQREYVRGTTRFVRSAVAAGRPVLVAVPGPNLAVLREALADLGGTVRFADMAAAGRNPGSIIPGVLLAFAAAHPGRVSIVGEPIWPGRSAVEYPACATHEALINAVFAGRDAEILCPYDATRLDALWLQDAWHTHPVMITAGGRRPSPWYTDGFTAAARFNEPLPEVPAGAVSLSYAGTAALPAIRAFVARHAAGLHTDRVEDLVLAVNELAENTMVHTPAGGVLSVWWENDHVVCQVDDRGHLADPLAGRVPPPARTEGGRGLLLANRLCDLLRIHSVADRTCVRVHMGDRPC